MIKCKENLQRTDSVLSVAISASSCLHLARMTSTSGLVASVLSSVTGGVAGIVLFSVAVFNSDSCRAS